MENHADLDELMESGADLEDQLEALLDAAGLPASNAEFDAQKVKLALCPTCGGWITQACFPLCETSKDMRKEFADCAKAGLRIDVVTLGEAKKLAYCRQNHTADAPSNANQLALF